uniref:TLC domain-containing protein n=1 Tax=Naja naja TaxID=35670 RepID=A0A8C6VKV2_NAJNA
GFWLTQWFWRQEYWLPPGITWEDMQDTEDIRYPQPHHLLLCFPIALLLIALRFLFYRQVLAFCSFKTFFIYKIRKPNVATYFGLAKQCDLPTRQVERWFRYRLNQNRPSVTKKFCEARVLRPPRTQYLDIVFTWEAENWDYMTPLLFIYALQPLHLSLYGYYLLQFSFYWTLVITMPFDIKQRDFNALIVHHVTAILLSGFSYCVNFIPIGSLVMILHDAPDTLMHAAKVFHYLKWQKTCNTLFIIFSVAFLFARTIFFPYKSLPTFSLLFSSLLFSSLLFSSLLLPLPLFLFLLSSPLSLSSPLLSPLLSSLHSSVLFHSILNHCYSLLKCFHFNQFWLKPFRSSVLVLKS